MERLLNGRKKTPQARIEAPPHKLFLFLAAKRFRRRSKMKPIAAGFKAGNGIKVVLDRVCVDDVTLRSEGEEEARSSRLHPRSAKCPIEDVKNGGGRVEARRGEQAVDVHSYRRR